MGILLPISTSNVFFIDLFRSSLGCSSNITNQPLNDTIVLLLLEWQLNRRRVKTRLLVLDIKLWLGRHRIKKQAMAIETSERYENYSGNTERSRTC